MPGRKCASREDLTDRVASNDVGVSDRSLHRSVGSELPKLVDHYCQWQQQQQQQQQQQHLQKQPQKVSQQLAKSVKSPSSSESSRKRHGVTGLSSANHRDPWAGTSSASHYPPSSSCRKDELSSPGSNPCWPFFDLPPLSINEMKRQLNFLTKNWSRVRWLILFFVYISVTRRLDYFSSLKASNLPRTND